VAVPTLTGIGTALPASRSQAELWDGFFREHYQDWSLARRVWHTAGVKTRHGVADPLELDARGWSTAQRIRRFHDEGLPLALRAVEGCLDDAGLDRDDVGLLSVVTCTGYGTPGLDILLARDLGLNDRLQRLHIGHMGCYGAVPGLAAVSDAAAARGQAAVLLCLELTSLHIQPPTPDVEQLVAHALFSDAAVAAAVVPDGRRGFDVVDVVARTDVAHAGLLRWNITIRGSGWRCRRGFPRCSSATSSTSSGNCSDHAGWDRRTSPAGPCIPVVRASSRRSASAWASRRPTSPRAPRCCATMGTAPPPRCSWCWMRSGAPAPAPAPGARDLADGDQVVFMAFGPGLTLYAALLRVRA
jgi:3-oxoacyl-[acyl-carrier-protein] synthase III